MKPLTFYSDNGHGWLQVTPQACWDIGLDCDSFSKYSYRDREHFYLEEDCDAAKFIAAFQNEYGIEPRFKEYHVHGRSPIRNMARMLPAKFAWLS